MDIALLSRLDMNTLRAICKENMPSWISFPEYERVGQLEWGNNVQNGTCHLLQFLDPSSDSVMSDDRPDAPFRFGG